MKSKKLSGILAVILCCSMLAGCGTSDRAYDRYAEKYEKENDEGEYDSDYEEEEEEEEEEPIYPNVFLITKLDIYMWNYIQTSLWDYGILDLYTYYSEEDIWNEYKAYLSEYTDEYNSMSDLELWNYMKESSVSNLVSSADYTAQSICHYINEYMANSGSDYFNESSISTLDITVKGGVWDCVKLGNETEELENLFPEIQTASIKVFYQYNECIALAFIEGKDTQIELGTDCPNYTESGFEYFT